MLWPLIKTVFKLAPLLIPVGIVTYYVVKGIIDKKALQEKMYQEAIKTAILTLVNTCENRVRLKDLAGDSEIELRGDGISSELKEGQEIYAY